MTTMQPAPEWDVSSWINTPTPLSLAALRGRPIVAAAFQMLCPGCVAETIPQLKRVRALFAEREVAVLGLHSVFEHQEAMREPSLRAFLYEYRATFPVAIDRHADGQPVPETMRRYRFRGTPTLMLIDAKGMLRRQIFGHVPDLQLGAEVAALIRAGTSGTDATNAPDARPGRRCDAKTGPC